MQLCNKTFSKDKTPSCRHVTGAVIIRKTHSSDVTLLPTLSPHAQHKYNVKIANSVFETSYLH